MILHRKHLGAVGVGALWAILSLSPAMADDTELFVGVPNAASTNNPNILFILDNSGSMATDVRTQPIYDPAQSYAGSCSANNVYWRTGTGNPPDCSTTRWFNKSALMCKTGLSAIDTAGTFTDTMAQYDESSGSGGRRWETIAAAQKSRLVECQDDNGLHGDGAPAGDVYPRNGQATPSAAWTATAASGISWGQTPANQVYTIFSGNYLNWLTGPTAFQTRLEVVQSVATNLLNSINGVNVGLMTYNPDQGGWVRYAVEDIATARSNIIAQVNGLRPDGFTPLSETLYEAGLYYAGKKVDYGTSSVAASRKPGDPSTYKSPLDLSCQKNFVVYLTDGEPTKDRDADAKIVALKDANGDGFSKFIPGGRCDVEVYPDGFSQDGGECLDEMSEFLYEGDQSPLPGRQNVITYTIGFTLDLPILADTAARGGGAYYTADDTASLTSALSNIVTSILDTQTTFISPTVSVNSFNRTQNLNDLFVSVFKASGQLHWPGNLKKYRLRPSDNIIVDANGNPAVDPTTGFFSDSAQSFWSANVDGANVEQGGAASHIPAPAARNVYTYLGNANLTDTSNRISKSNAGLTDAVLNTGLAGDPTRDQVIDFITGVDVPDTDQDNNTTEPRNQMGDPLHAQPATVIYGPTVNDATVYFATNDGFLHAIDSATGIEKWAFVPPDFLDNQIQLFLDDSSASKNYGIDGSMRVQMLADADGIVEPGEKVYLYFGVRRGGDVYYGLDISNPNAPQLLWRKDSGSLPGVGQTWSTPVATRINISGASQNTQKFVLVLGGGYEPDQDNVNASTDTIGNSIYILDSVSGALLWHGSKDGINADFNASGKAMDYSIPADVKVVDFDGDDFADRMYASDMGGQVWRFDIYNGQPASTLVTGGVMAQLGSAGTASPPVSLTRRFYYSPDVAMVNTEDFNFIHVGIGSGHRAHPLSLSNQDRFYALRDYSGTGKKTQAQYNAVVPVKDANLVDVTTNINATVGTGSPGWRFELRDGGWNGEKVLADARTFNNNVFFTTFRPSTSGATCEPQLGTNRLYVMSLINGAPVNNLDGSADPDDLTASDRFREFEGSISSEVVFIFPTPEGEDTDGDGLPDDNAVCEPTSLTCRRSSYCLNLQCFDAGSTAPVRTFWAEESAD